MRDQIAALVLIFFAAFGGVYAMLARGDNGRPAAEAPAAAPSEEDAKEGIARFARSVQRLALPSAPFRTPDGKLTRLSDFAGRVVLVNLWASWCAPCLKEMPSLDRLQKTMGGKDFEVVAINLDRKAEVAQQWIAEQGIKNLAFYRDEGLGVFTALGAPDLPLSVLVDRQGREVGRLAGGAQWDSREARALVQSVIEETPPEAVAPPSAAPGG